MMTRDGRDHRYGGSAREDEDARWPGDAGRLTRAGSRGLIALRVVGNLMVLRRGLLAGASWRWNLAHVWSAWESSAQRRLATSG